MRVIKILGLSFLALAGAAGVAAGLFFGLRYLMRAPSLYQRLPAKDAINLEADLDWSVHSLDGRRISMSEFSGKPLVINFWATWCYPCRLEMPSLERLYDRLNSEGYMFFAVTNEKPDAVRAFLAKHPTRLPVYVLGTDIVPVNFDVNSIPRTFVVSPAGRIRFVQKGAAEWDSPARVQRLRELALEKPLTADRSQN